MAKNDKKTATKLVHSGRHPKSQFGFVNTPPYRGSTVLFPDTKSLISNKAPYTYGRKGTPSISGLEELMNEMEGARGTLFTPSGLAAITLAFLSVLESRDHVLISDSVYYPTRHFCDTVLNRMGIQVSYYDPLSGADISSRLKPNTRAVFIESPGSQTFEMQDLPAIRAATEDKDIFLLVDNTWATPLFHNPLKLGADIVIHSCTKYITGHSDALLGAVCCNKRSHKRVRKTWEALGNSPGSEEVFSGLKGLRTLEVRAKHHEKSGLKMAKWLKNRSEVSRVLYPPLPDDPGHAIWKRDFSGSTGLLSLILKPQPKEKVAAMLDELQLFGMGWSWGGFESLVVPFDVSNIRTATKWKAEGPGLRFHIGLEDTDDLKADLESGFKKLKT